MKLPAAPVPTVGRDGVGVALPLGTLGAWIAFACALIGLAATWIAGAWVVQGDRAVSRVGQTGEELIAALIGLEAPLLAVADLLLLLVAAGGATFT
jgi:hypothetical protein